MPINGHALSNSRHPPLFSPASCLSFAPRPLLLLLVPLILVQSVSLERIRKVAPNGKEVLNGVSLGMYLGAKIGVLGSNGAGKSSLMRILAGEDTTHDGRVVRAPGIRLGYLEQEPKLEAGETVAGGWVPACSFVVPVAFASHCVYKPLTPAAAMLCREYHAGCTAY